MQIAVIGSGYVGLVSGVCFSEFGFRVTCVDNDSDKVAKLQQQIMPIYEPGLDLLVENNRRAGRLSFSNNLKEAVINADVVIIAVGTPQGDNDIMPDMSHLEAAVKEVAKAISKYTLVIVKSTVPVGTNRHVAKLISSTNPEADFDVVSNPEFLREGMAIKEFMSPDRVVAGVDSRRARDLITRLYEPICLNGAQLFFTTFESAEMIKYAANSFLAMRVAYINEIADLCEATGANIRDVAKGMGMDHRIGNKFLSPGPGYGGSCLPKDTNALKGIGRSNNTPLSLVEATIASNEARKERMTKKIIEMAGGDVSGKTIAILGLTFKPGTDDMRESPSLVIIPALLAAGASIRAYDPQGMKEAAKYLSGNISWCKDEYDAMEGADMLVLLTEWNEFRSLDLKKVRGLLKKPDVVDLRNVYKRQDMQRFGFRYISVGRRPVEPGQPWIPDLNMDDEEAA
jgi:UDPglucose 6-dehydrogenase